MMLYISEIDPACKALFCNRVLFLSGELQECDVEFTGAVASRELSLACLSVSVTGLTGSTTPQRPYFGQIVRCLRRAAGNTSHGTDVQGSNSPGDSIPCEAVEEYRHTDPVANRIPDSVYPDLGNLLCIGVSTSFRPKPTPHTSRESRLIPGIDSLEKVE